MTTLSEPRPTADALLTTDLAAAVRHWSVTTPDAPAITYLDFGGREGRVVVSRTYAELDREVRGVAERLQRHGVPGDRVAVLCSHGPSYVVAFLACLYADRLAVPLYVPTLHRSDERLHAVLPDAGPIASVVGPADVAAVEGFAAGGADPGVLVVTDGTGDPDRWVGPEGTVDPDRPAYLQYTSGSTRAPAGVVVSHGNLTTAMRQIRRAFAVGDGPLVSWLPFFHDMGLVFTLATPLQAGGHGVYLSPVAFVQHPIRWLRAISDHGATVSVVPNFGLDFAVQRVKERDRAELDLSTLRVLANGSEPVRASSVEKFTEVYAPSGFRPDAHSPGFGLAEATLLVSANPPGVPLLVSGFDRDQLVAGRAVESASDEATTLVGCGPAWEQDVRIVDADGTDRPRALQPGGVGEIWVRGANVCAGYWRDPERSREVFGARLPGEPGTWLRTGDVGFLHRGELFVAGRTKDLIIVGGKNHYPVDLEATVSRTVPESRAGHVAAFGVTVPAGTEAVVVVVEIEPKQLRTLDTGLTRRRVRAALGSSHEVPVADVVLARVGAIPKTTSGKLRRSECRARYADGSLRTID